MEIISPEIAEQFQGFNVVQNNYQNQNSSMGRA